MIARKCFSSMVFTVGGGEVAHHPAILDHGADESSDTDLAAVLALKQHALGEVFVRRHRSQEPLLRLGRTVRVSQKEVVLAENLDTRMADAGMHLLARRGEE